MFASLGLTYFISKSLYYMHISETFVTVSWRGGRGARVMSRGSILIRKITGAAHQVFRSSVLRWQNYPLSWDNAFHFCRIFPSRVKVGLWSWGETRTCQLLMLGGRSPKVLFFYGESSRWIPIELMDVLLSLMYFLLLTGNFFLWMYNQVLSRQDVSLFKEIAAS